MRGGCRGSRFGCGVPKRRSNSPCMPPARLLAPGPWRAQVQSTLTLCDSRSCRPRSGCAYSGEPSRMRVTRGPLNLANSRCFTMPCGRRPAGCAERLPARWLHLRPTGSESSVHPRAALQPCADRQEPLYEIGLSYARGFPFGRPGFPWPGQARAYIGGVGDVKPPRFTAERR